MQKKIVFENCQHAKERERAMHVSEGEGFEVFCNCMQQLQIRRLQQIFPLRRRQWAKVCMVSPKLRLDDGGVLVAARRGGMVGKEMILIWKILNEFPSRKEEKKFRFFFSLYSSASAGSSSRAREKLEKLYTSPQYATVFLFEFGWMSGGCLQHRKSLEAFN